MAGALVETRRVVVTGLGVISPLGLNAPDTWQNLIAGKSGIRTLEAPPDPRVNVAGAIVDFDPEKYFPKKELSRIHRSAQFAFAATVEALNNAGLLRGDIRDNLQLANIDPDLIGLRIGTGVGGTPYAADMERIIQEKGAERIPPSAIFQLLPERTFTVASMGLGIRGPGATLVAACATGSESIADAVRVIKLGEAKAMIAGGTEATIDRISAGAFAALRGALSKDDNPETASKPFNEDSAGFVMAEGAGLMVLEDLEHAVLRGANIYAEVAGYADTLDAYHETAPSGEGARRAIRLTLERGRILPSEVDYINAHGTSTPTGDPAELLAIRDILGEYAKETSISSTKSATGHLLGAAGGLEAVIAVLAIRDGIVPPTLNLRNPRSEAEGLDLVPLVAKRRRVNVALSNSFGFGGINSVLAFKRYTG